MIIAALEVVAEGARQLTSELEPVREWAVSIAAPVVLALLHQDPLGGRSVRARST